MERTIKPDAASQIASGEYAPPFLLRLGSALIDYILLIFLPVCGLLSDRIFGIDGLGLVTDRTLWFLGIVLSLINVVVLPVLFGQSLGKMITSQRIVSQNGERAGIIQILGRQTIGYLATLATLGLGFFISVLGNRGRTLHDFLTGTVVVRATRG